MDNALRSMLEDEEFCHHVAQETLTPNVSTFGQGVLLDCFFFWTVETAADSNSWTMDNESLSRDEVRCETRVLGISTVTQMSHSNLWSDEQ